MAKRITSPEFHAANPHVYHLYKQFALQATERRRYFSARAIIHRIRWFTMIETDTEGGLKINDHLSSFYARLFMKEHPEHDCFFSTRRSPGEVSV